MKMSDLRPAGDLIQKYGVKALVYGKPGLGKTPTCNTAPRPILLSCEPGLLSMKGSKIPTYEAHTYEKVDEFFKWFFESSESKNFDTLCIDSQSQIAEIVLQKELKSSKDGRKVYGNMSQAVMVWATKLFYMQQKHIYLICKEGTVEEGEPPVRIKRPYFPGNDLNIKIPHLYDEIFHLEEITIPTTGQRVPAFRTKGNFEIQARDRSGMLNEFEPTDLTYVFNKCMGLV